MWKFVLRLENNVYEQQRNLSFFDNSQLWCKFGNMILSRDTYAIVSYIDITWQSSSLR